MHLKIKKQMILILVFLISLNIVFGESHTVTFTKSGIGTGTIKGGLWAVLGPQTDTINCGSDCKETYDTSIKSFL